MRRGARLLMYVGVAVVVLGLGKVHAAYIGNYDLTGSARFAWAVAYIGLLCASAYGVGLPELPGRAWPAFLSGVAASAVAAVGVSLLQLVVGDALLPRFVVFWSAVLVVPGFVACNALSSRTRRRSAGRVRVVAVVGSAEEASLRHELDLHPERPATLVLALSVADVHGGGPDDRPLVRAVQESRGALIVLDGAAQGDDAVVAQAAQLHETGVRVRTLSLFYDEWLGKLPVAELERMALMFDIGEVHRLRYQVRRGARRQDPLLRAPPPGAPRPHRLGGHSSRGPEVALTRKTPVSRPLMRAIASRRSFTSHLCWPATARWPSSRRCSRRFMFRKLQDFFRSSSGPGHNFPPEGAGRTGPISRRGSR